MKNKEGIRFMYPYSSMFLYKDNLEDDSYANLFKKGYVALYTKLGYFRGFTNPKDNYIHFEFDHAKQMVLLRELKTFVVSIMCKELEFMGLSYKVGVVSDDKSAVGDIVVYDTWTNTAAVVLQLDIAYRTISSTRDKIEKAFSIPCLNVLMSDKFHLKYVADEAYYYAKKAVKQQKSQNPFIDAVAQEEVKPLVSDVVLPEYKRAPVAPRGRKPKRDLAERTRARTIRRAARKEQRKLDNYAKGVYRAQQS